MKIKKILCAVDFSEYSTKVTEHANSMAEALAAEIDVLYVSPSMGHYSGFDLSAASIQSFENQISTGAQGAMDNLLKTFKNVKVNGHVQHGYPSEEILRFAKDHAIDMIIMGTRGRTGLDRILFGSVAEKVVKYAKCPVLTINT